VAKFAILIPTLSSRATMLAQLMDRFDAISPGLVRGKDYEIKTELDSGQLSTGLKRTKLLQECTADYFAFFDDDDWPENCYLLEIFKGIEKGVDVMGTRGIITWQRNRMSGIAWRVRWQIDLDCRRWEKRGGTFYRWPNHITPMKTELVRDIPFQNLTIREDYLWSCEVMGLGKRAGVKGKKGTKDIFDADPKKPEVLRAPRLKSEHTIIKPIYQYRCVGKE